LRFMSNEGDRIALAGVGSSGLGTAALARNIAGIVTGYGI